MNRQYVGDQRSKSMKKPTAFVAKGTKASDSTTAAQKSFLSRIAYIRRAEKTDGRREHPRSGSEAEGRTSRLHEANHAKYAGQEVGPQTTFMRRVQHFEAVVEVEEIPLT